MNTNKIDILCDQVIDVALVVKEAKQTIDNSPIKIYPEKFVNRIESVLNYCHRFFVNANNGKHTDAGVDEVMINLMNTLVMYKNSYNTNTYAYKVMNSLFDIVKTTFVDINK